MGGEEVSAVSILNTPVAVGFRSILQEEMP